MEDTKTDVSEAVLDLFDSTKSETLITTRSMAPLEYSMSLLVSEKGWFLRAVGRTLTTVRREINKRIRRY